MTPIKSSEHLKSYIKKQYGKGVDVVDETDTNPFFDYKVVGGIRDFTVELKTNNFTWCKWDAFGNHILIEMVQGIYYLKNNKNDEYSSRGLDTAMGWFYKIRCDRLIFMRYREGALKEILDIDFTRFFMWFVKKADNGFFKVVFSYTTTGTPNAVVDIVDIPKDLMVHLLLNDELGRLECV